MTRSIKRWAIATFILCFLVIIAGGVVRTTQSGMGCPDWPKCFGKWIPPTNASELPADFEKYLRKQDIDHTFNAFHTWIEYFNRLFGVLLGLFGIIQLVLLFRKRNFNRQAYKLSAAFLIVVILTGLFGALVVKFNLAHISISVHLLFAIILVQIQLALLLSLNGTLNSVITSAAFRKWMMVFLVMIFIQSALGTMVRMYVDDVSKALHYGDRGSWLAEQPLAFIVHRSFSWVALLLSGFIFWKYRYYSELKKKVSVLLVFVVLNMIAGIVLYYAEMPAVAQPVHLLLATFAITQSVYTLLQLKTGKSVI
ncbi:COX15/CtaA family protein [Ferruginibacter sp. SUN002]|uniref:COX15/CtaA family protein n=1 Tax=Ferruginibacter sp. SUN002 TaxID=2937789 RepID=UPI003D361E14